ncbi:Sap10 aspartyl proteinase [Candida orthopsilosis Co 90-125]|uniref:candidapepsin n=1 Tax=Candida orthopsilosis (strain 90-125) TaxID=1136231 RepID=H8WZG1_CANO9|nr:Sap10 aspartyl proteinase [Candida orthopsilosis Co 90-125]CCG21829.1 Sap10 aspartyl proteinase [Candida orthopsilosis Co 90-125]
MKIEKTHQLRQTIPPMKRPTTMSIPSISFLLVLFLPSIVESAISLDFEIATSRTEPRFNKRDTINTVITLQRNVYLTNLAIGSSKDEVVVSIDTGSSELWVMSKDVNCQTVDQLHAESAPNIPNIFNDLNEEYSCKANGTFNTEQSTTYQFINDDFSIAFADGSAAIGQYGRDDVGVGNVTIEGLKFGVAKASSIDVGILGIKHNDEYDNFISLLKKQGYIDADQYSIYLNDQKGTILFGGIDDTKYDGDLATTHMKNSGIQIKDVSLSSSDNHTSIQSKQQHVILDTGSTFSVLPSKWIKALGESINGTYNDDESAYQIPCDLTNEVDFNFKVGNTTFNIPVSDLVVNNERTDGKCYLGVMDESLIGGTIFGSDILKHFYVVFNLDEDKLSIAPVSKTSSTDSQSSSDESRFSNRSEASTNNVQTMLYAYCMSLIPLSIYVFVLY